MNLDNSTTGTISWTPKAPEPQSACPNCGYCPHCGRGGYHTYPYPYQPSYPWYSGNPYVTYTGISNGTQTITEGNENG